MKAWKSYGAAILLSLLVVCTATGGEIGELDSSFGDNGTVITSFGQYGDQAYAVALQPDGKILAAGSAHNGYDYDLAIARYNKDGSLDTSFNIDGKVRTSIGKGDEEIMAIGVQDDGYIVAAGYTVVDGGRDFMLARFTPAGDLDHSFGEGGIVITEFGNQNDEITAMTIDEDGKIVVCGYVTGTAGMIVALARYRTNGDLDITFGDGGVILTDIGDDALARSIDIDEEGRIVAAGSYYHQERTELMVLRFLESGGLDTGFGEEGIGVPADRESFSEGFGVRLLEDGRIVVAGAVGKPGDQDAAVFRFTESGQPDTSFGDNGVLVTAAGKEDDMALAIDVLDNIVGLSGYNTFNTKKDFLFVSVEEKEDEGANVALNLKNGGFSSGGVQFSSVFDLSGQQVDSAGEGETTESAATSSVFSTTPLGYTEDVSYAVVLQADGKAVSVGYSDQDGVSRFAVARYITPVASANGEGGLNTAVNWILTREPTNVNRTGAYTGGSILDSGLTITQRGVVFSITPDPVLDTAADGTNPDDPGNGTGDTTPPVISVGSPTGELPAGTTDTPMTVTTNENATCKYSANSDTEYDLMPAFFSQTGTKAHSVTISPLEDGQSYTYFVRCIDAAGNASLAGAQISFSVRIGPNISNGSPSEELAFGTTETTMSVSTDVNATCKFSEGSDAPFDDMTSTFTTTGTTTHSILISPLENGMSYDFFVRCEDAGGVQNTTGYQISFSVAAAAAARGPAPAAASTVKLAALQVVENADSQPEEAPLAVSNGSPAGEIPSGSFATYIGVYSSERATCRYSSYPELDFDSMGETMMSADNISHIAKVIGLMDGHAYEYYVRCRGFDGKENGTPYRVAFEVSGDGPVETYRQFTRTLGRFFLGAAHAQQTDPAIQDTTGDIPSDAPASVFDLSAPAYAEKGSTDDGGGPGSYSSILENLKPGTFYYVRAYAVDENNKVYYGNQLGFKTADSCFIATAAYGTLLHPYVTVLRSFRDQYLTTSAIGRSLVNLYYHYSPPVADYIAARPVVRNVVRVALLPVVGTAWLALHVGFAGMALLVVFVIIPSLFVYRSYRRIEFS